MISKEYQRKGPSAAVVWIGFSKPNHSFLFWTVKVCFNQMYFINAHYYFMFWNNINEQCSVSIQYDDGVLWRYICVRSCPDSECKLGIPPAILQELLGEEAYMRWEKFQLQVNLGGVLQALQNILSKFVHCRNRISCENFKLKFCMCAQSHALGAHTKFQLEILIVNKISGIVYFRKFILKSFQNVSKTTPWVPMWDTHAVPEMLLP